MKARFRYPAMATLLLATALSTGCLYIIAAQAAAVSAGVVVYGAVVGTEATMDAIDESLDEDPPTRVAEFTIDGDLIAETPHSHEAIHAAAVQTFLDALFEIEANEISEERGLVIASSGSGKRVVVELEKLDIERCRIKIRVGEKGEFQLSEDLFDQFLHLASMEPEEASETPIDMEK